LAEKKEIFKPINPPHVGMYVCGPTVYGDAHLGHSRPAITFDILFRYLEHLGYKVRYVRNITDVGHLENDADVGDDKIAKKARLERLEPMEVVQFYTIRYHRDMDKLNVKRPSIEPQASGHIIEQMEMVKMILESGFAYKKNGSVYFDVNAYAEKYPYGELSGRKHEELLENTRELASQDEKKNAADFALWKKGSPEHIMRWPSQWSDGFPGWHMECSAMSKKYLGNRFDIHGGGMDLIFPHHESEIAQSKAANNGEQPVNYWMHNNMITINGQKMGKSLGNFITLEDLFNGQNSVLDKAYSPMNIRFFMLQAHYRSPLDFSNAALQAAEKGYQKLITAIEKLENIHTYDTSSINVDELIDKSYAAINDDLNTPILIAHLFDGVKKINLLIENKAKINQLDLEKLSHFYRTFVYDILGLKPEQAKADNKNELLEGVMKTLLELRAQAKQKKDWNTADLIRNELTKLNIRITDTKDGALWELD
jgi:cysteinyl-tRNA synthetase